MRYMFIYANKVKVHVVTARDELSPLRVLQLSLSIRRSIQTSGYGSTFKSTLCITLEHTLHIL